jgi:hypothetical protein
MTAKKTPAEKDAFDALTAMMTDPAPRVLHGSAKQPGVFQGTSTALKAAARVCLKNGWLEPTGQFAGTGKSRKDLYRITLAGLQAVTARGDQRSVLEGLGQRLDKLQQAYAQLPARIAEFSHEVATLQHTVQQSVLELRTALDQTIERLKPHSLDQMQHSLQQSEAPASSAEPASGLPIDWTEEMVRLVGEQKQRHVLQRLTLTQLYSHIQAKIPHLTLGDFHDGLRRLHDQGRIRLGPYTQALPTLDDTRVALYLDREVKYYVELP